MLLTIRRNNLNVSSVKRGNRIKTEKIEKIDEVVFWKFQDNYDEMMREMKEELENDKEKYKIPEEWDRIFRVAIECRIKARRKKFKNGHSIF